ncbi:MAG: DM13 domain-containing protein [Verrucomicrobiota bacterium]
MKKIHTGLMICLSACLSLTVYAEEQVLHQGESWVNKSKKIRGTWKIVEDGGKTYVVLGETFKTSRGPDLKIFLSPSPIAKIGKKDKVEATGKQVALLKSPKGGQRYEVPAGLELKDFKSMVIHCEKYTVVWGGVDL